MLVIKIKLHPRGSASRKKTIGKLVVWNDGTGTALRGNYKWELFHGGFHYGKSEQPWKTGTVRGFRRRHSPYRLLARVLEAAGEAGWVRPLADGPYLTRKSRSPRMRGLTVYRKAGPGGVCE